MINIVPTTAQPPPHPRTHLPLLTPLHPGRKLPVQVEKCRVNIESGTKLLPYAAVQGEGDDVRS